MTQFSSAAEQLTVFIYTAAKYTQTQVQSAHLILLHFSAINNQIQEGN